MTVIDDFVSLAWFVAVTTIGKTTTIYIKTHLVKLELLSNATPIDNALHYIRNKQKQQQKKGHGLDSTSNDDYDNSDVGELSPNTTGTGRQTVF